MGSPTQPKPVKLFAALLAPSEQLFERVEARLGDLWGTVEAASAVFDWEMTDYYAEEMGPGLKRRFVAFAPLISPEELPEAKLAATSVEAAYRSTSGERRGRTVNIDPGYLDVGKVVLASTKNASHRLYLGQGIYGEITLLYQGGSYRPLDYTYADYRWPQTLSFFSGLRAGYLNQLKRELSAGLR
jgi:hypothetical protein